MTSSVGSVRLAIINNAVHPDIYKPVAHWTRFLPPGCVWEAFPAAKGSFPDPGLFSHVLLTGSEASIVEPGPWVGEEAGFVREAVGRGLAVLGSCWGHQLLAFALAGPVHVGRAPEPEIGWVPMRVHIANDLLGPKADEVFAFSLHFDEVRDVSRSFEILASSSRCPVQAMRLKGRPVWGLQAHPEIDPATARRFLEDLVAAGFKGGEHLRRALKEAPRDSGLIRRVVAGFLASGGGPD